MKARIKQLNEQLLGGKLSPELFRKELDKLLAGMDWQKQLPYRNLAVL